MVKLVLLYKHPAHEATFEQFYALNLVMLERMPGIVRRQANMVLGSPFGKSPYYRSLELYFDTFEAMDAAMTSPEGQAAGQALMKYAGDLVELLFVDVMEAGAPSLDKEA